MPTSKPLALTLALSLYVAAGTAPASTGDAGTSTARSDPLPLSAADPDVQGGLESATASLTEVLAAGVVRIREASQAVERCRAELTASPDALGRGRYARCRVESLEQAKRAKAETQMALEHYASALDTVRGDLDAALDSTDAHLAETERDREVARHRRARAAETILGIKEELADATTIPPEARGELQRAIADHRAESTIADIHEHTLETLEANRARIRTYGGYLVALRGDILGIAHRARRDIDVLNASQRATAVTGEAEVLLAAIAPAQLDGLRRHVRSLAGLDIDGLVRGGQHAAADTNPALRTTDVLVSDDDLLDFLRNFNAEEARP